VILRAALIAPICAPLLKKGYVQIRSGRIVALGAAAAAPPDESVTDLGNALLMPGLINPHTHLELTAYAGKLPPASFWEWAQQLVKLRRAPGRRQREQQAAYDGAWLSLRAGVTCVGDVSRENLAWQALRAVPIRKVCFAELLSFAAEPPRNLAELRAAIRAVEEDELLTAGISPHASYSVTRGQLQEAVKLASRLCRPWCTHWAETKEEVAFLAGDWRALPAFAGALAVAAGIRPPRMSPAQYLLSCTAGLRPGLLIHGNYLSAKDAESLARAGHSLAYCPRSHAFFGHEAHPFGTLRKAGLRVVIATDSAASNEDLSLLKELRHLRRNLPDAPRAEELLTLVTIEAAAALGLQQQIGSLEPGKAADLCAFECDPDAPDPLEKLIEQAPLPKAVWVSGRRVV
jgi:cytosine/adenosine deaminase-related metal-dependent hydrolase